MTDRQILEELAQWILSQELPIIEGKHNQVGAAEGDALFYWSGEYYVFKTKLAEYTVSQYGTLQVNVLKADSFSVSSAETFADAYRKAIREITEEQKENRRKYLAGQKEKEIKALEERIELLKNGH